MDPAACSFRSCLSAGQQLPRPPAKAPAEDLQTLVCTSSLSLSTSLCTPSPTSSFSILGLLLNSLEAALIAPEGRLCCLLVGAQSTCLDVTRKPR